MFLIIELTASFRFGEGDEGGCGCFREPYLVSPSLPNERFYVSCTLVKLTSPGSLSSFCGKGNDSITSTPASLCSGGA